MIFQCKYIKLLLHLLLLWCVDSSCSNSSIITDIMEVSQFRKIDAQVIICTDCHLVGRLNNRSTSALFLSLVKVSSVNFQTMQVMAETPSVS